MSIRDSLRSVRRKSPQEPNPAAPIPASTSTRQTAAAPPSAPPSGPRRQPSPERHRYHQLKDRLPDGAVFHVEYSAAAQTWTGTLTVNGQVFKGTAGGVFRLLVKLDDDFRAWKAGSLAIPKE
jgi:hypothetical protein